MLYSGPHVAVPLEIPERRGTDNERERERERERQRQRQREREHIEHLVNEDDKIQARPIVEKTMWGAKPGPVFFEVRVI